MAPAKVLASRNSVAAVSHTAITQPGPAHVVRSVQRFGSRLGSQFGGAVTYFLVLAIIPIAMFTFAALGFGLEVLRPDLIPIISAKLETFSPGNSALTDTFDRALNSWRTVGIIGIVTGLYSGQGFVGNLKKAVRFQIRVEAEDERKDPFIGNLLHNIGTLLVLIIGILLTLALTVVGTGLQSTIAEYFELPGWITGLLVIIPSLLSLVAAWLIFMFLFTALPEEPIDRLVKAKGSFIGALAFIVLLNLATVLIDLFSSSPTASLFGSVIAVMLTMNIFARIILYVAAWMGTATPPQLPEAEPDEPLVDARIQAQSLGALVVGTGIVVLTLLGFKRFEERTPSRS